MSDCKHNGRMKKYIDLLAGDHVLRWKCAKCNERFSPTAAAHADGIEAARRAVEGIPHGTSWFSSFIEDALAAIDSIGDAPDAEGGK